MNINLLHKLWHLLADLAVDHLVRALSLDALVQAGLESALAIDADKLCLDALGLGWSAAFLASGDEDLGVAAVGADVLFEDAHAWDTFCGDGDKYHK